MIVENHQLMCEVEYLMRQWDGINQVSLEISGTKSHISELISSNVPMVTSSKYPELLERSNDCVCGPYHQNHKYFDDCWFPEEEKHLELR